MRRNRTWPGKATRIVTCIAMMAWAPARGASPDIREAFARAQAEDPTYLQAVANLDVARSRRSQARSQLLPQLGVSAATNWNDRRYDTRGSFFPPTYSQYSNTNAQITLSEALWRHPSLIGYHLAGVLVSTAEYQQLAAMQDLGVRLLQAWLEDMAAADQVAASNRALAAADKAWQLAQRSQVNSLASQPELDEAAAKLESARADLAASEGEMAAKRAALEEIVGPEVHWSPPVLAEPAAGFLVAAQPLAFWLDRAEERNPAILAGRAALEASRAAVRKERAAHEPTLDLVASYGRNNQGEGNFPGQLGYDIRQKSVGLQLTVPLYSGGSVSARVHEALAEQARATQQLNAAIRTTRTAVTVAWNQLLAARARQSAAHQAVRAAQSALALANEGRQRGVKADTDVFTADAQLAGAERDLGKANYDLVLNTVKLKAAAADFSADDFDRLAGLMIERPFRSAPATSPQGPTTSP